MGRRSFSRPQVPCILVLISVLFGNERPALGQQFVDESTARLPPDPLEYSEQADFADIDGDGDIEIFIANGRSFFQPTTQEQNRLLLNDGTGHFVDVSVARFPAGLLGYSRDIELGDVDSDSDLDIFVANYFTTQSWLWLNDGTAHFINVTSTHLPIVNLSISDADFGDIDDDGDLDLILANNGTINPGSGFGTALDLLYLNDGSGHFTDASVSRLPGVATQESIDFDFFDMDGDLDLDLVNGHRFASTRLWRNDSGFYVDVTGTQLPLLGDQTYSVDPGDIDGDGDLDILVTTGAAERAFRNNGSGTFTNSTATAIPSNSMFTDDNDGDYIDMNNDGHLDYVIAFLGSGPERAYINNGSGAIVLTAGVFSNVVDATLDIEFGDVDGDGASDAFTAQGEAGVYRNRLYMNQGPADTLAPRYGPMTQLADTDDTTGPYVVRTVIRDDTISDNNFISRETTLRYRVNGGAVQAAPLAWVGGDIYRGGIPGQASGGTVTYRAFAVDQAGNTSESAERSFVITPGAVLGDIDSDGDVDLVDRDLFVGVLLGNDKDPTHLARSDINIDGATNGRDVEPFVAELLPG